MWRAMSLIVRFYLVDLKLHATLCVCLPVFATNTSLRMTMKHSCSSCSVDILCEASRVYSISPIRPTCLYSRLDYSRAIYQITAPRLSGVQTDGSYDPWEGDHGWAVLFICSHVRHAYRLCELICGSITLTGLFTHQQQWSSHHCYDQSVFSSLWRCGISERPPIFGGFFAFKK